MIAMKVRFGSREVDCALVVFDKTGTITDLKSMWIPTIRKRIELLERYGDNSILEPDVLAAIGFDPFTWEPDPSGPFMMRTDRQALTSMLTAKGFSRDCAVELVSRCCREADDEVRRVDRAKLIPGVDEVLRKLKRSKVSLALATMDRRAEVQSELTKLGVLDLFDATVTLDDISKRKPDPEMIETICARLGISPKRTVMVGDIPADMLMGKNAGVALTVGYAENPTQEIMTTADVVVSSYSEISVSR
jgi:phosphoglycolate phosphatase